MRGAAAAEATPARSGGGATTATFKAPLLARILEGPESEQRLVALDLGTPCQPLIDRIAARQPCRIEIADFVGFNAIASLSQAEPEALISTLQGLLPPPNQEQLNLIFCWDLPNYLPLPAIGRLVALLGARAAPGCRLHMLISYSRRDMPLAPSRYVPVDEGQLEQRSATADRVAAPRYSPEDLGKALNGFRYERGVLLANGMQEFVYAWPGTQPGADVDRSTAARPAAARRDSRRAPASAPAKASTRTQDPSRG